MNALDVVAVMIVAGVLYHRRSLRLVAEKKMDAAMAETARNYYEFPFLPPY